MTVYHGIHEPGRLFDNIGNGRLTYMYISPDIRFHLLQTEFRPLQTEFRPLQTELRPLQTEFRPLQTGFKQLQIGNNALKMVFRVPKPGSRAPHARYFFHQY